MTRAEDAPAEAAAVARQLAAADPRILSEIKQLLHREAFGGLGPILAPEAQAHGRLRS